MGGVNAERGGKLGGGCLPSDGCRSSTTEYPFGRKEYEEEMDDVGGEGEREGDLREVGEEECRRGEMHDARWEELTLYYKRYEKRSDNSEKCQLERG